MTSNHIQHAWKEYAGDFNAMTDDEIAKVTEESRRTVEEEEDWLEAVASWEQAGKPRNQLEEPVK